MDDRAAIAAMVTQIARGLVDTQDALTGGGSDTIEINGERGQVIGRGGRVAHALRSVTQAAGRTRGVRATLDIVD